MEPETRHQLESVDVGAGYTTVRVDEKKRSMGATERDEEQRAKYRERVKGHQASGFVVIDECGSNVNLTPLYARAPRGERAYGKAPRNTPANTTLIASMTTDGMGPAMLLTGAADTAAFEAYIERVLVPSLCAGQVVVMDNLSAHKSERVRQLIEERECQLWYLPSYSPDLSPIEEAFSKLKQLLRRAEARTRETLETAIVEALELITARDARGYFAHCGYGTTLTHAQ